MKSSNFPAKIVARKERALQRLKSTTICGPGSKRLRLEPEVTEAIIRNRQAAVEEEKDILDHYIRSNNDPIRDKSKKDRSAKAKISYGR